MSAPATIASAVLGGTTTMMARQITRRAMHKSGVSRGARARSGTGMGRMLVWAAAAGVLLALVDLVRDQRKASVG